MVHAFETEPPQPIAGVTININVNSAGAPLYDIEITVTDESTPPFAISL